MSTPLSRRGLVSSAPAAVLAATLPVLASAHLDADLVDLGDRLRQAKARCDGLWLQCDDIYEQAFRPPPMPDVLLWRAEDHWPVWPNPGNLDGAENADGKFCRTYATTTGVAETLTEAIARWKGCRNPYAGFGPGIVRAEAIVAALKIYQAEEAAALAACGYTAAADACQQQEALIADLVQRIASTPARTPEGVCAKAQAAIDASIFSGAALTEMLAERLLVKQKRPARDAEQLLMMSAMLDAAKLHAAPSGDRRAA